MSEYEIEKYDKDKCKVIKNTSKNNQLISTYNGIILTNDGTPDEILNSSTDNIKHYSERNISVVDDFALKPEKQKVKCFSLHTKNIKNM